MPRVLMSSGMIGRGGDEALSCGVDGGWLGA